MTIEQAQARFHRVAQWARERYITHTGTIATYVGGKPTTYTRIIDAAYDRFLKEMRDAK